MNIKGTTGELFKFHKTTNFPSSNRRHLHQFLRVQFCLTVWTLLVSGPHISRCHTTREGRRSRGSWEGPMIGTGEHTREHTRDRGLGARGVYFRQRQGLATPPDERFTTSPKTKPVNLGCPVSESPHITSGKERPSLLEEPGRRGGGRGPRSTCGPPPATRALCPPAHLRLRCRKQPRRTQGTLGHRRSKGTGDESTTLEPYRTTVRIRQPSRPVSKTKKTRHHGSPRWCPRRWLPSGGLPTLPAPRPSRCRDPACPAPAVTSAAPGAGRHPQATPETRVLARLCDLGFLT